MEESGGEGMWGGMGTPGAERYHGKGHMLPITPEQEAIRYRQASQRLRACL